MVFFRSLTILIFLFLFCKDISKDLGKEKFFPGKGDFRSETCGNCHKEEYKTWKTSAHGVAATNERYRHAFMVEPDIWCINCHSPIKANKDESNEVWFNEFSKEGVNCASCHVRNDIIYSSKLSLESIKGLITKNTFSINNSTHSYSFSSQLGNSEFCASCHEFNFQNHKEVPPNQIMQSTFSEYFQGKGNKERECQTCHFPNGSHGLPGPMHPEFLKKNILWEFDLKKSTETTGWIILCKLEIPKIGHAFPTGDLFRVITISAYSKQQKIFQYNIHKLVRVADRKIIKDTRLYPNNQRIEQEFYWQVDKKPDSIHVDYHYQGNIEESLKGKIPEDDLIQTIFVKKF